MSCTLISVECSAGTYRDNTVTICTKCPENSISEQAGAASCTFCPAGTVSNDERTQCGKELGALSLSRDCRQLYFSTGKISDLIPFEALSIIALASATGEKILRPPCQGPTKPPLPWPVCGGGGRRPRRLGRTSAEKTYKIYSQRLAWREHTDQLIRQSVNSVQITPTVQTELSPVLPARLDIRLTLRKLNVVCRLVNRTRF